ncbi:MAG TPA: CPBP family intramembrane glutamic endopeptidase [Terriglobales bacterium]|jgi:hypothetical protein
MDKQDPANMPSGPREAAPSSSPLSGNLYFGPHGLRAGWRFFLYLAMVLLGLFSVNIYARHGGRGLHTKAAIWNLLIGEVVVCAVAFIPAVIMSFVEKRAFGAYGLPARQAFGKQFWIGTLWGLVSFSVLILALRALGVFEFGSLAEHGLRAVKFGVFYAGLFLVVGFTEEFLLRGYSQFTLAEGIGFWPAGVVLSLTFGALHIGNSGEAVIGIIGVIMIGLIFCLTLKRTGSLWFAVGMHAAWDWAESFVYSVADSGNMAPGHLLHSSFHGSNWLTGGSVGPEGSVLIFIVLPALWILFDKTHPAKPAPLSSVS